MGHHIRSLTSRQRKTRLTALARHYNWFFIDGYLVRVMRDGQGYRIVVRQTDTGQWQVIATARPADAPQHPFGYRVNNTITLFDGTPRSHCPLPPRHKRIFTLDADF